MEQLKQLISEVFKDGLVDIGTLSDALSGLLRQRLCTNPLLFPREDLGFQSWTSLSTPFTPASALPGTPTPAFLIKADALALLKERSVSNPRLFAFGN
jgi:hypothetical protein